MLESKVKKPNDHRDPNDSDLHPKEQRHCQEAKQDDFLVELDIGVHGPQFADLTQQWAQVENVIRLQEVMISIRRDATGQQGTCTEAQPSESNVPAVSRASGKCCLESEPHRQKQSKREPSVEIGPHDHQWQQPKSWSALFLRRPGKRGGPDDDDR